VTASFAALHEYGSGTVRFELTQQTPPPFAPLTPLPIAWLCSSARADRRGSERGHAERM